MDSAQSAQINGRRERGNPFKCVAPYELSGDQPQAVERLTSGIQNGMRLSDAHWASPVRARPSRWPRPSNACRCPRSFSHPTKHWQPSSQASSRSFSPTMPVNYFVSYYDYYQPEAYVPQTDTYIEKDSSVNEEVEKMRHAATSALLTRKDVIVVASVSCIYGIGSPENYAEMAVFVDREVPLDRDEFIYRLIDMQYDRNDYELERGSFRVCGDSVDVFPPYMDNRCTSSSSATKSRRLSRSTASRARRS